MTLNRSYLLLAGVSVLGILSCTRTIYVHDTDTRIRADTLMVTAIDSNLATAYRIDSVYIRDSVYVAGDTIMRDRLQYRYRLVRDTVWRSQSMASTQTRCDTVTVYRHPTSSPPPSDAKPSLGFIDSVALNTGRVTLIAIILTITFYIIRKRNEYHSDD